MLKELPAVLRYLLEIEPSKLFCASSSLQVFRVFYVAWLYQLSDVDMRQVWVRGVGALLGRLATAL